MYIKRSEEVIVDTVGFRETFDDCLYIGKNGNFCLWKILYFFGKSLWVDDKLFQRFPQGENVGVLENSLWVLWKSYL